VGHWRLKGYDCAIDDFGKDGSSYRRLLTVPFNVLKLDCALLWRARQGNDSEQTLLAREKLGRMVELAHSMDMLTIAEGIETAQDYDVARAVGCQIGQGYLLSKPLTIPDFIARLTH
jgi:EAL domain-containing protein (putative c-di-GMP-specific phosphodiesterase class I)